MQVFDEYSLDGGKRIISLSRVALVLSWPSLEEDDSYVQSAGEDTKKPGGYVMSIHMWPRWALYTTGLMLSRSQD